MPDVAVLGASGYAGAVAAGLLHRHPGFDLAHVTARAEAGERLDALHPRTRVPLLLEAYDPAVHGAVDAAVVGYPHGASAPVVAELRDRGVHLEMALTSNVQTGAVADLAGHAFIALLKAGLSVSLNTDCRTISGTTLSAEYGAAADALGLSLGDLARATQHAAGATFLPDEQRRALVDMVRAGWAGIAAAPSPIPRGSLGLSPP